MRVGARGHGGGVEVEIVGYEDPSATNIDDANWLSCVIDVELHSLTAHVPVSLMTHQLASFSDELGRALSFSAGSATVSNYEKSFELTIVLMSNGRASIFGFVAQKDVVRARLEFTISSDQSYVASTFAEVRAVLEAFPVVAS